MFQTIGAFVEDYMSLDSLLIYPSLSSSLESVWIDNFYLKLPTLHEDSKLHNKWFLDICFEFAKNLKNLKILALGYFEVYEYEGNLTKEEVSTQLFDRCPSLRVFVYRYTFVKNVITQKVDRTYVPTNKLVRRFMKTYNDCDDEFPRLPDFKT